jgi:hypothetical protein
MGRCGLTIFLKTGGRVKGSGPARHDLAGRIIGMVMSAAGPRREQNNRAIFLIVYRNEFQSGFRIDNLILAASTITTVLNDRRFLGGRFKTK